MKMFAISGIHSLPEFLLRKFFKEFFQNAQRPPVIIEVAELPKLLRAKYRQALRYKKTAVRRKPQNHGPGSGNPACAVSGAAILHLSSHLSCNADYPILVNAFSI